MVQYKSQFASQQYDDEITALLRDEARKVRSDDATWRVMVDPETDLPEQKALALILMPPGCEYAENGEPRLIASPATEKVLALSQRCGTRGRTYRNTLLFLLPSPRGLGRLRGAFRDRAALDALKHDYGTQLDAEQRDDLTKRLTAAHKAVTELLSVAYTHIARVEGQDLVVVALSEAGANLEEHLRAAWRQVVEEEEWVLRKVGTVTLQKSGLVPKEGGIRVRDAIDAFLRLTDKPMIATRSAVVQGLLVACRDRVIGLGRGINSGNLTKKWCGESVEADLDEDGVWIIPPFEPAEQKGGEGGGGGTGGGGTGPHPPPDAGPEPPVTGVRVRRISVRGDVAVESWSDLFRCFVNPLARMHPKKLTAGAEFDATFADGQGPAVDDTRIKALIEAANQLGLTVKGEK